MASLIVDKDVFPFVQKMETADQAQKILGVSVRLVHVMNQVSENEGNRKELSDLAQKLKGFVASFHQFSAQSDREASEVNGSDQYAKELAANQSPEADLERLFQVLSLDDESTLLGFYFPPPESEADNLIPIEDLEKRARTVEKDAAALLAIPVQRADRGENGPTILVDYTYPKKGSDDTKPFSVVIKQIDSPREFVCNRVYGVFFKVLGLGFQVPHSSAISFDKKIYLTSKEESKELKEDDASALHQCFANLKGGLEVLEDLNEETESDVSDAESESEIEFMTSESEGEVEPTQSESESEIEEIESDFGSEVEEDESDVESDSEEKLRTKEDLSQAKPVMFMEKIIGQNMFDFIASGNFKALSEQDKILFFKQIGQISALDFMIGNLDRFVPIELREEDASFVINVEEKVNLGNLMFRNSKVGEMIAIDNDIASHLKMDVESGRDVLVRQRDSYKELLKKYFAGDSSEELSKQIASALEFTAQNEKDFEKCSAEVKAFSEALQNFGAENIQAGWQDVQQRMREKLIPFWFSEEIKEYATLKKLMDDFAPGLRVPLEERMKVIQGSLSEAD